MRFTVASGVRSSWAITPMVLRVLSNRARRRLALEKPSIRPISQEKAITTTLANGSSKGCVLPPMNSAVAQPAMPPVMRPSVARRQSVAW